MGNMEIKIMIIQLTSGRQGALIPRPKLLYSAFHAVCKPYPEVGKLGRKDISCFLIVG